MPILENLSDDLRKALGPELFKSYTALSKKSTIRDDKEASDYVDGIVKRLATLSKVATGAQHAQRLNDLKTHGAWMTVLSFSQPDAARNRLDELKVDKEQSDKLIKAMEQAGGRDEECAVLATSVLTCETSVASLDNGHHHHCHRW